MANESYVASADDYGSSYEGSSEYDRNMQRSTRVLSRFNSEQKKSIVQTIRQTSVIIAASSAINNVLYKTVHTVSSMVKAFTLKPMMDGLREYTSQIEKFRSIMQNTTQFYDGDTVGQIEDITNALDRLNDYADLTIYKFSDMVDAIQGFSVAGLNIDDATTVAEGLASLTAAMGGDQYTYQSVAGMFNQAIQRGHMIFYQWRSISQFAKVGGMQTKQLLVNAAKVLGTDYPEFDDSLYEADGVTLKTEPSDESFEASLQDEWLTTAVMVEAMKVLAGEYNVINEVTGEMDEAATKLKLAEMGYTDTVIELAMNAKKMAQEVRSAGQMMDAVFEAFGTGWAKVFRSIFGNTEEATALWTGLMNTITDDIGVLTKSIEEQADKFVELGGRDKISKIFENLWGIIRRIGKAFGKLVPENIGEVFYNIADAIEQVTSVLAGTATGTFTPLQAGTQAFVNLLGSLVNIFWKVVGVVKKFWDAMAPIRTGLWTMVSKLGPQIEQLILNIIDWVDKLVTALADSGLFDAIGNIFTGVSDAADKGLAGGIGGFLKGILEAIANVFGGVDLGGIFGAMADVGENLTGMFTGEDQGDSALSFVGSMLKIILALKLLTPAFKSVAGIAKSFNGVTAGFTTIIGSVIAVVIALEAFNQIDSSTITGLFWKAILISIELKMLAKGIKAIVASAKETYKLIPIFVVIGIVVAAVIGGIVALTKIVVDVDAVIKFLNSISAFLKSIAWIIGTFALLLFALSARAVVVNKNGKKAAKETKNALDTIGEILKNGVNFNGKLKLNTSFQLGDATTKRILALSAMIASIGWAVMMIGDEIKSLGLGGYDLKKGGWTVVGIAIGLTAIVAGLMILSKVMNIGTVQTVSKNITGSSLGSLTKGGGRLNEKTTTTNTSGSKNPMWSIAATLLAIGASVYLIAEAIQKIGSMDKGLGKGVGVVASIVGILAGLIVGVGFLTKYKVLPDTKALTKIGIFLAEVMGAVVQMALIVAGLGALAHYDAEALWIGYGVMAAIVGILAGVMVGLTVLSRWMDKAAKWSNITMILLGFLEIAGAALLVAGGIALLSIFDTSKIIESAGVILATLLLMGLMMYGASQLTDSPKGYNKKSLLTAMGIVAEIAIVIAIVAVSISRLANMDTDQMWTAFGVISLVIFVTALILSALTVLAGTGIGTAGIGLAVLGLLAIASAIWIIADAFEKFSNSGLTAATAVEKLVIAISMFLGCMDDIMELDIGDFADKLEKITSVLTQKVPELVSAVSQLGTITGGLILAGGDVNIGAGQVAVSSAGAAQITEGQTQSATAATEEKSTAKKVGEFFFGEGNTTSLGGVISGLLENVVRGAIGGAGVGAISGLIDVGWDVYDNAKTRNITSEQIDFRDDVWEEAEEYYWETGDRSKIDAYYEMYGTMSDGDTAIVDSLGGISQTIDEIKALVGGEIDVSSMVSQSGYGDAIEQYTTDIDKKSKDLLEDTMESIRDTLLGTEGILEEDDPAYQSKVAEYQYEIKKALDDLNKNGLSLSLDDGTITNLTDVILGDLIVKSD